MTFFRVLFYSAALFFGTIVHFIFLFARVVVKAIGWVVMVAVAAPGWLLRKCVAVLESISVRTLDALSLTFSLQWKTWVIAIPACWMLYVELRHIVVG